MRIGILRGLALAIALIGLTGGLRSASADGFHDTIPREVLAYDINTGGPYFAPPVPWGHYAKDGLFDHFYPKPKHSLLGLGHGCGILGCKGGHGGGLGHGCGLLGCKGGCGMGGQGLGLGHGCKGDGCGDPGHGHGRRIKDCGLCGNKGCGMCRSSEAGMPIHALASGQAPTKLAPGHAVVSPQMTAPVATPQCADAGCVMGKGHVGGHGSICDGCSGKGCGKCGGKGLLHGFGGHGGSMGDACGGCSGRGCGKCGGTGLLGKLCGACGGKGCGKCGLGSHMKGKLAGLLHHGNGNIKYFVGPGGPVPLTPGYVPYVVTTRSPRDFLAFPPYTPSEP